MANFGKCGDPDFCSKGFEILDQCANDLHFLLLAKICLLDFYSILADLELAVAIETPRIGLREQGWFCLSESG